MKNECFAKYFYCRCYSRCPLINCCILKLSLTVWSRRVWLASGRGIVQVICENIMKMKNRSFHKHSLEHKLTDNERLITETSQKCFLCLLPPSSAPFHTIYLFIMGSLGISLKRLTNKPTKDFTLRWFQQVSDDVHYQHVHWQKRRLDFRNHH